VSDITFVEITVAAFRGSSCFLNPLEVAGALLGHIRHGFERLSISL
jgi:hypothetical protein